MYRFKVFFIVIVLGALTVGWRSGGNHSGTLIDAWNMTLQDTLLLVSDPATGVHVYDVRDPGAPMQKYVIDLHYNRGTAMKGDILYANDWEALYAIRLEADTFTVVKKIVTFHYEPMYCGGMVNDGGFGCACGVMDAEDAAPTSNSTGSSYATFAVVDDYLYYFDSGELVTMDISTPEDPVELSRKRLDWSVETIYPTQGYLYLGGSRGMYIYSRRSPSNPVKVGRLVHARACDPVVVSGRHAYVTLRGGNRCGQVSDVFLVVSVGDPTAPEVESETPLPTPYGLTVDYPLVYVGNGRKGLTLLGVRDASAPDVLESWPGIVARDFIWDGDILYVMEFEGITVYDVTDPRSPVRLSHM
jgi:hypothetical protein